MKARPRQSRILCGAGVSPIKPGTVSVREDEVQTPPDLGEHHASRSSLRQREGQSASSLSSNGAMNSRARQSKILHVSTHSMPGAASMHEDEEVQAVTSSLQQQESHSVSSLSSTGAMKARARQSWILSAGTPIKPGMVSVHDVKGGEPIHANFASENSTQGQTTTKIEDGDAQESSSMQNYRVVGRSPTDDQPGLNAKAVHNQASVPSLPGAVASTEEEQLKAKEGSVQWTDPLDEVSNINPSFQASARSMDTYSQFAKNPDFVHLLDSSLPSRENPEQSRLG